MKRIFVILITLSAMLMLISCNADNQEPSNDMPDMGVKAKNWNTSIRLADDPMLSNSFNNGQVFTLRVENLSDASIVFPNDFGMNEPRRKRTGYRPLKP